jgi:hypothetical protein
MRPPRGLPPPPDMVPVSANKQYVWHKNIEDEPDELVLSLLWVCDLLSQREQLHKLGWG